VRGDRARLQPEKDPKSKSSEWPFLLVFFGKFKKEYVLNKRKEKTMCSFFQGVVEGTVSKK